MLPRPLLSRLQHDLAELLESPYPGVSVIINEANIQQLCLVLTPPSGPWKDLALHFDVELPNHWPSSPPMIYSSVADIKHPNLHGNYVCCDLLKEQEDLEIGYTGGYTPALTLRGLFLQFLTFFSSTKVEQTNGHVKDIGDYLLVRYEIDVDAIKQQDHLESLWNSSSSPEIIVRTNPALTKDNSVQKFKNIPMTIPLRRVETVNPDWYATYKLISKWRCRRCPYGSDELPVHRIPAKIKHRVPLPPYSVSPCPLGILDDDCLLELSRHLLSESLVSFSAAYPRFRRLITSNYVLLERELRCFFLRNPLRTSILGIGIALEPGARRLSSDFDWLSLEAFDAYNVRQSIQKRHFQYFLPLAFNRHHFERAEGHIWSHLGIIDAAIRDADEQVKQRIWPAHSRRVTHLKQPHHTVGVVYKLMNNIVVALMRACDDVLVNPNTEDPATTLLHASEKAVTAYGHLYHLLLCLSRRTPLIFEEALDRLCHFIQVPESRVKAEVPDLGELIVLITFVLAHPAEARHSVTWATINGPFLREAIIRNVLWVLKRLPVLEVMEFGSSDFRLYHTFMESKTSLRLIMFQVAFLDIFVKTYTPNLGRLDDNYGFPEPGIPARMVEEVKAIYKVNTWPGFFHRVHYARGLTFGKEGLSESFRDAIRLSASRDYHTPKTPQKIFKLSKERENTENKWLRSHGKSEGQFSRPAYVYRKP